MKRIIFILFLILNFNTLSYSQNTDVLREDDILEIIAILPRNKSEIYVFSGRNKVKKCIGDTLLASQAIVWGGNEWIKCYNERTQSSLTFPLDDKNRKNESPYDQRKNFYQNKIRATRGVDDEKKYMEELLSGTWYMCLDSVRIESRLPQSIDERRLYFAEPLDGGTRASLDYDSETNEIVISKSRLEKMGIGVSDNKAITLNVYYYDGGNMILLSSELKIIYRSYDEN